MFNQRFLNEYFVDNVLDKQDLIWLVGWLVSFYGISTFVGYLMPNTFLYKSFIV